jgi:hypothetical protein
MSIGAWAVGIFGLFTFASSVLSFSGSPRAIALRRKSGSWASSSGSSWPAIPGCC